MAKGLAAEAVRGKELAGQAKASTIAWGFNGDELNVTVLVWRGDEGSPEHVNNEREVLVVALEGTGEVVIDGVATALQAGDLIVIPRGTLRRIRCTGESFAYLTCHRKNPGLWIEGVPRA